jgi:predicted HTH domain antitoxin
MELTVNVPDELVEALGPQPERGALEALLAELIFEGHASVAYAGSVLGLSVDEAIRWYTSRGHSYPDLSDEDLAEDLKFASDSDATKEDG